MLHIVAAATNSDLYFTYLLQPRVSCSSPHWAWGGLLWVPMRGLCSSCLKEQGVCGDVLRLWLQLENHLEPEQYPELTTLWLSLTLTPFSLRRGSPLHSLPLPFPSLTFCAVFTLACPRSIRTSLGPCLSDFPTILFSFNYPGRKCDWPSFPSHPLRIIGQRREGLGA